MSANERLYQVGLTLLEGIGDVLAKQLLAYCGSAEAVFQARKGQLEKIPGIGPRLSASIHKGALALERAEEELRFLERGNIQPLFFSDMAYPRRLKECVDGPVLLYYKGGADLNASKVLAIIGTRQPSAYGRQQAETLVTALKDTNILVISGLAYGIDALAHKTALDVGLETVGVMAHGLDRVYPAQHNALAQRMLQQGGLLSDFRSGTQPDAQNFPRRNRIVAGLCDAVVVIESRREGGSLITATIAHSYNRDVFAFPGRAGDVGSEGCNGLIKQNKAGLIENAADLLYQMQWEEHSVSEKKGTPQMRLFPELSEGARQLLPLLEQKPQWHADELAQQSGLPLSKLSALLLELEFAQLLQALPGKCFRLTN